MAEVRGERTKADRDKNEQAELQATMSAHLAMASRDRNKRRTQARDRA